ncbi:hypothetical protein [Thalassorhabdomicrobium marinisediminis]|uniref:DUF2244 domain-containing protein n=1 Tax=Thalassorhabdomicrobium marinisediminis TaxID=2170577 RepID=A0A2T7FTS9_9RHOB|nr:hypothetical protein [Thalassorhabdomicrobium marinisediminis]PVA05571.1 hypothetical protein DC363_13880 [Thalassorhabdomicrobium marinisediminis]
MNLSSLLADPLRVLEKSDPVLEIENRPVRRATITMGGILLAVAMALAAMADGAVGTGLLVLAVTAFIGWMILDETVQLTQLRLDRPADQARLRVTGLKGRKEQNLRLSNVCRAETRIRYGKQANQETIELYLVGSEDDGIGETLIPLGRADTEDVIRIAALITDWLKGGKGGGQP